MMLSPVKAIAQNTLKTSHMKVFSLVEGQQIILKVSAWNTPLHPKNPPTVPSHRLPCSPAVTMLIFSWNVPVPSTFPAQRHCHCYPQQQYEAISFPEDWKKPPFHIFFKINLSKGKINVHKHSLSILNHSKRNQESLTFQHLLSSCVFPPSSGRTAESTCFSLLLFI